MVGKSKYEAGKDAVLTEASLKKYLFDGPMKFRHSLEYVATTMFHFRSSFEKIQLAKNIGNNVIDERRIAKLRTPGRVRSAILGCCIAAGSYHAYNSYCSGVSAYELANLTGSLYITPHRKNMLTIKNVSQSSSETYANKEMLLLEIGTTNKLHLLLRTALELFTPDNSLVPIPVLLTGRDNVDMAEDILLDSVVNKHLQHLNGIYLNSKILVDYLKSLRDEPITEQQSSNVEFRGLKSQLMKFFSLINMNSMSRNTTIMKIDGVVLESSHAYQKHEDGEKLKPSNSSIIFQSSNLAVDITKAINIPVIAIHTYFDFSSAKSAPRQYAESTVVPSSHTIQKVLKTPTSHVVVVDASRYLTKKIVDFIEASIFEHATEFPITPTTENVFPTAQTTENVISVTPTENVISFSQNDPVRVRTLLLLEEIGAAARNAVITTWQMYFSCMNAFDILCTRFYSAPSRNVVYLDIGEGKSHLAGTAVRMNNVEKVSQDAATQYILIKLLRLGYSVQCVTLCSATQAYDDPSININNTPLKSCRKVVLIRSDERGDDGDVAAAKLYSKIGFSACVVTDEVEILKNGADLSNILDNNSSSTPGPWMNSRNDTQSQVSSMGGLEGRNPKSSDEIYVLSLSDIQHQVHVCVRHMLARGAHSSCIISGYQDATRINLSGKE